MQPADKNKAEASCVAGSAPSLLVKTTMARQIELQGVEQLPLPDSGNLLFLRRTSDRLAAAANSARNTTGAVTPLTSDGVSHAVRIYTLGRFSLLLHGEPARFGRKTPHRPLELLKAIIAFGGRDISYSMLTTALWPDSDGDDAKRAFDTTLFRLRKILGDDRIVILQEGKVSLDARYCWTDVWAFERLLGRLNRIRNTDASGREALALEKLTEQLLSLYQDHFLAREDMTSWSVSLRERLRSKYIHNLLQTGRYWETRGFWEKAIDCYQKGLEVDDLIETFYQRLMVCYRELQRYSEGLATYRRCCRVLSITLGLLPEAETETLNHELQRARAGKQQSA
jgi:two-component SAPR family response regulator